MCGITGILTFERSDFHLGNSLQKMNDIIKHRGPDDEGYVLLNQQTISTFGGDDTPESSWQSDIHFKPELHISEAKNEFSIGLAHRRLAILDLSPRGHQPLANKDKNIWITYNGEIYNYPEIKKELEKLGHEFFSETDTEVILKSYEEWGFDCVKRFDGMWAFVIIDRTKNIIFGSRDRFGVKPLYYYKDKSKFLFASEQKSILNSGLVERSINDQAAFEYLTLNQIEHQEEGLLKGIFELFPAHNFTLDLNKYEFKKWQYFNLDYIENVDPSEYSERRVVSHIRFLIADGIRKRMRSDVEVGSCLSGGLDSSAIVSVMDRYTDNDIQLYTSVNDQPKYDERKYAKSVVDQVGGDWHCVEPSANGLRNDLEQLVYDQDIPLFSTSTYAQWKVMQKVKETGIKVVLDGQGGDELFGGYDIHYYFLWLEMMNKGKLSKAYQVTRDVEKIKGSFFFKQFLRFNAIKQLPSKTILKLHSKYFPEYKYINSDLFGLGKDVYQSFKDDKSKSLNERLKNEFFNTSLKSYLKCEDRCSMAFSIESRTPFADDINLIKYLFSLPGAMKIKNGQKKYLLREATKPYVPQSIYDRKDKLGYVTPNNEWIALLRNDWKEYFNEYLDPYVNTSLLLKEYDQFFNQPNAPENRRIFKFIAFASWKKVYDL